MRRGINCLRKKISWYGVTLDTFGILDLETKAAQGTEVMAPRVFTETLS